MTDRHTTTRAAIVRPSQLALAVIGLVALVTITFGRTIGFGYVNWDDQETIFENPAMRPPTAKTFVSAWTDAPMAIYMPLTRTAWAALAKVAGQVTPSGYVVGTVPFRVFGLGLHLASTLMVFAILRTLLRDRTLMAAWVGAACFAVHPLQVEAVAWISGEKDLLAGLFTLFAVWLALQSVDGPQTRRSLWLMAAWAAGTCAMLSKPQAVMAPAIVAAVLVFRGVLWRRAVTAVVPLCLLAVPVMIIGHAAQPADAVATTPIWTRPILALDAVGWYATKLVMPIDLTLDYGRDPVAVWQSAPKWAFAALGVLVISAAFVTRRRWPAVAAGVAIALCGVLPVLGLVPFDFQQYSTVADHYLYTAMLGVGLIVGIIVSQAGSRFGPLLGMVLITALAALSWRQSAVWRSSDSLFQHALAENPRSLAANRVLGYFASRRGDDRLAIRYLETALADHPRNAIASFNLANAYLRLGEVDRAVPAFETAVNASPRNAAYRHNHAIALIKAGRLDEAEAELKRSVALDPRMSESRDALAKLQLLRGTAKP